MGLWDLVPVAKFKSLFLIIIVFWVLVTLIDFQTFNTRYRYYLYILMYS